MIGTSHGTQTGAGTYSYVAYGLSIRSELPLPELTKGEAAADIIVRLGEVDRSVREAGEVTTAETGVSIWAKANEACLFQEGLGACLVRGGREIIVDPEPGAQELSVRLLILSYALAVLVHQRGLLALHASAVEVNGEAVAFAGQAGGGKSTTAAALHARGYHMVADDLLAIDLGDGEARAILYPGSPQFKLWPEAAVALGDDPERLPRLRPGLEKRARRVTDGFRQTPLPLGRIYVLEEGTALEITEISPAEALTELMSHSYYVPAIASGGASQQFLLCASLASKVPMRRLTRPRSIPGLPNLISLVEEDVASAVC